MSISVVHLITGEQLITKVEEIKDSNGESLCFRFIMPMACSLIPNPEDLANPSMNFFAWSPFSSSREFKVAFEKIVAVCDPTWKCFETYVDLVQPLHPILSVEEFEQYKVEKKERAKND